MRSRLLALTVLSLPLFVACATDADDNLPTPFDDEFPVSEDNVNAGAPDNSTLPDDNKADAQYPVKFEIADQSPVKSQGSRGVCSIFASTALIENLYIKAGMPVAEADFSEQYLQWAAKAKQGAFTYTEGSNASDNLKTVVTYGTVKEAAWPYESTKWTAANDPACTGGENLPTKCYTNGEPPQAAVDATKFKLPSTRWINTNSIKAHLTTKKSGVNVGMTFYYQAWNHRGSTIPVDAELWRQGVVTYPNAKDKTESATHRAGHAITIIGWDDNKEVIMRDGDNKPIIGANGQPQKEKGFWLFKNSWGTASFGTGHPYGAGYGWLSYKYVSEFGSAVTAEIPSLIAQREVCDDGVGADEDGDGQENCDDSDCTNHPSCAPTTDTEHNYTSAPAAAIPDNSPTGVSSTITVADTGTVTDAKLTVDIAHTYSGDLTISLTRGTDAVVVYNRTGGATDNVTATFPLPTFAGKPLAGAWTLKVVDGARIDTGTLKTWSLQVTSN